MMNTEPSSFSFGLSGVIQLSVNAGQSATGLQAYCRRCVPYGGEVMTKETPCLGHSLLPNRLPIKPWPS